MRGVIATQRQAQARREGKSRRWRLLLSSLALTVGASVLPTLAATAEAVSALAIIRKRDNFLWCTTVDASGSAVTVGNWAVAGPDRIIISGSNASDSFSFTTPKLQSSDASFNSRNAAGTAYEPVQGTMTAKGKLGKKGRAKVVDETNERTFKIRGKLQLVEGQACHNDEQPRPATQHGSAPTLLTWR
jgi:hypothetical protein